MPRLDLDKRPAEHPLLGMPRRDLVVTVILIAATAALFAMVANSATLSRIQRVDDAFLRRMVAIRTHWLTSVGRVFDFLGSANVTWPVRVLIAGYLALRRRWWHFAAFVSAMAVAELTIGPLKGLYDRVRPLGPLVHTSGSSFPSGHAVATSVVTVAAVIALFPEGAGRYAWGALAVAFSLLMALSRAYLAAHWLSDAVAGVLLGTSVALICALVVHWIRVRREGMAAPPIGN